MKRPVHGGAEQDAFSGWRRYFRWRPGARKYIKRKASRRERRQVREQLRGSSIRDG